MSTKKLTRREFLSDISTKAIAGLAISQVTCTKKREKAMANSKPNIILILADDLGYGDLGCYGQKMIKTPSIDRMAEEGIRFTQHYAGSTICAPSRCSLMTGYHQGHAYIRGNEPELPLRREDITVAEVLQEGNYSTGIIGKWGLGDPNTNGTPNKKGFDNWFGYLNQRKAHNYYPDYLWRNDEKVKVPRGVYSHDLFTKEALEFIRRESRFAFFLCLTYTIPHANPSLTRRTGNGMEIPDDVPYSNELWPQPEKNYAAMVTRMDRDVGRILDLLKELNIDENTVIYFASDNGPHEAGGNRVEFFNSNGPLRDFKRSLYEGGIRVPMIVRWTGHIEPSQVSNQVWAFWDFLPTVAEIAGVPAPKGIDGISMLPVLLNNPQNNHDFLYWEVFENGFHQAARLDNWKAIRSASKSNIELYDLSVDIEEQNDVASQHPEVTARIEDIFRTARTDSKHYSVSSSGPIE